MVRSWNYKCVLDGEKNLWRQSLLLLNYECWSTMHSLSHTSIIFIIADIHFSLVSWNWIWLHSCTVQFLSFYFFFLQIVCCCNFLNNNNIFWFFYQNTRNISKFKFRDIGQRKAKFIHDFCTRIAFNWFAIRFSYCTSFAEWMNLEKIVPFCVIWRIKYFYWWLSVSEPNQTNDRKNNKWNKSTQNRIVKQINKKRENQLVQ